MAMAKEKNNREQLLLKQKLMSEKEFADEKARQEKIESDEKQRHQLALYQEQIRHEKAVSDEKHTQQKLLAQKDRKNNMLLTGAALIFITGIFIILFIKQRNQKKIAVEKANAIHKMAELEMQSLRTQLNPHFMFNSLNSIQELILLEENERSHSYLSRFAKLLRMLLENAEKPFISIRKELDFLQLYLSLENLRVPDLQYSISTDPKINSDETLIPNMILQPYIENAIWHGLSHREKNRQLQIRIYRENGTVNYEIEDNGVGRKKAEELKSLFRQKHQSKGMELLSKRFKLLNEEYSSDIHTDITDIIRNNEVAGTLVTIKVPVKLSEHLLN
jgi:LytS/YehU family sensor histidine kinase